MHHSVAAVQSCLRLRSLACGLLCAALLNGCAIPLRPAASATRDRAFVSYTPGAPGDERLRLAVKDIIDMKGEVTTAGSQYLTRTRRPAANDAELMARARERDVLIVGKTNLTEFALGVSGMNEFFGTPINPLDKRRIPGGSSSGSAVAVANDEADVAFGSDTAGSIRVPAACCGILGLKTTFGLVPLDGVVPLAPRHLDTIGPLAKDVPRLVQGMDLLSAGFAAKYEAAKAAKSSGQQITAGRLYLKGTDPKIDRAIDAALAAAGFRIVVLDERFKEQWRAAQANGTIVATSEGWLNDRKYLGKLGVAATTGATIQLGQIQYNTAYKGALRKLPGWQQTLESVFEDVDVIALPTLQKLPPRKPFFGRNPVFEARVLAMQNTVAVNYAGNPAIAIPVPVEGGGFPVASLQLVGPRLSEAELVNAARLVMP